MRDNKQNVLIVHNYYKLPGGEGTVVSNEKKMLENYGHNVYLYSRDNKEIDGFMLLQKAFLPFNYLFNIKTYREIKGIIKSKEIDVVHVHNTINIISPSVYYAAFAMKTPVVQTVHNFRFLCPNGLFYRDGRVCEDCVNYGLRCAIKHNCYRNSKLQTVLSVINMFIQRKLRLYSRLNYICLTEFNKNKLLLLRQINNRNIFIKPNFTFNASKDVNHNRKRQIVFGSRLDENKGIKFLFETWKEYGEKAPELLVYGDGELKDWCNAYIKQNRINNIKMMGQVEPHILHNSIKESLATIFCSQLYEGFPMAIIESFSCATPVVCCNFGNHGSLIVDGVNGYRFTLYSKEECIDKIETIIGNKTIYDSTYSNYLDNYTEERNYKILKDIYDTITN